MNRTEVFAKLRPLLLARRERLRDSLTGELSLQALDDDDSYEDEIFSHVSLSESKELAAIDDALRQMREGTYGICEECGQSILLTRLEVLPYTTTCIECQRQSERNAAHQDDGIFSS